MYNFRAAIYGAGAMGTVLGAFVTAAGGKIDLITRNREHARALKERGAKISGKANFTVPVSALTPDEMTGEYDVIILMTKQSRNARTVEFLLPYLAKDGVICTAQNGLPEPSVAAVAGRERTLGCAVSWGATFIGAGEAALTSSGLTFALGSIYGKNDKIERVSEILSLMGEVYVDENFLGARWAKLAINAAFSPLSAVSGKTFGQIAKDKNSRALAQRLLNEAFCAAEADGVKVGKIQGHDVKRLLGYKGGLKRKISFALIPTAMKKHADLVSGMYYDLVAGKPCEVDYINGVVVETAAKNGVPAPLNAAAVELVHAIERGERKPGEQNLSYLYEQFL